MPINGVDLSSNQGHFDFNLAVQQGYKTAYIKLGGQNQGGNSPYVSGVYAARVDAAHAAGMIVGHYWVPGLHDPVGSANYFASNLHGVQAGDYFVLDNEKLDSGNAYNDAESAAWINTVHARVGGSIRRMKHYESESPLAGGSWPHLLASGCGFIVAWYGHLPLAFTSIGSIPADRIDGHQFADNGNVGGASPVDLNAFKDTAFSYGPEEDDMPAGSLIRVPSGSLGYAVGATFTPLQSMDEVQALGSAGLVPVDGTGHSTWVQLGDTLIWNLLTQISARAEASASGDVEAVAAKTAALVVPAILAGLQGQTNLTQAQVESAAETAIRDVLGSLKS